MMLGTVQFYYFSPTWGRKKAGMIFCNGIAEDVIHVGDSFDSDVRCPGEAGITGIWLNRDDAPVPDGVTSIKDLSELEEAAVIVTTNCRLLFIQLNTIA